MMKELLFTFLLIGLTGYIRAQNIQGFVFHSADKTPVEFANVAILNLPDSSLAKGVITYPDGKYSAPDLKPGTYYIKASYVGMEISGTNVTLTGEQSSVMADTIFLTEKTEQLEDVTVTGNYVRAKEMVDRTVYEILPEIEKTSTNGYDVLRKIPSVQVDFNDNITLNGKTNFIIQVDGKQRDKEFLARIRPGDIESIEVIQNPSGRYEGDIEGILNIILKKEARMGVNGMFGMQLKPLRKPTLGATGSIDYGRQKATFYISGYSFLQRLYIESADYRRITLPRGATRVDSILDLSGSGDFSITASSLNTGVDYYLNDKNTLSLNYSFKPYSNKVNILNNGEILIDTHEVNRQENATNVLTGSSESNISAFYRKKFKKPIQEFTIESIYYFFNSKNDNDFKQILFPPNGQDALNSVIRNEITINDRNYFNTKIDYVQPVGVDMRLEAGIQFFLQNMDYTYRTNTELASNNYNYAELRNAAYASFYWKLKKFSLQATVRTENSNIDINSDIKSKYTTLLPSVNLLYKFNTKHSLKLTYNRRINRPNLIRLNPFERLNNDLSVTSGNPYLKPEYKDRLQLSYTLNIKKVNFAPYIYHEFYSNKIDNFTTLKITSISEVPAVYSVPENLLTGYEQGFGMNATIAFFNLNGSIYRGHFNSYHDSLSIIPARDYSSFRLMSYVAKPLFKEKFNLFAFINFNGAVRSAQTLTYSPLFYGAGFNQKIKNHTWGIFYLLPLSKSIQFSKVITETPIIYSKNIQLFDASWFVQVMYSYKFNKGRAVKKSDRNLQIDSDTQGGGLGR